MADLPEERTKEVPPFTYCRVDMFGPFLIKERRSYLKKYAALFTCFSCRAVHIEPTDSLNADSFIMALRRFVARRGNVRTITSDNGTNFVGACSELKQAVNEMDDQRIREYLSEVGADWIKWKRNPPNASNMGGVWERQIRSARAILDSLLSKHGSMLNSESLHTLFTEVEAIINCRPLTVETISDVNSPQPLSPANLLTHKLKIIFPPLGAFEAAETYCRKQWRRVQYIAGRKEVLASLQPRKKWTKTQRSIMVGDVVLLKDESRRNLWPMALVTAVHPDQDGRVRSVTIWIPKEKTELHRPCNKLVVLVEVDSPTRSLDLK